MEEADNSLSEARKWPRRRRSFFQRLRGGDDEFNEIVKKREVPYGLETFESGIIMFKAALHGSFLLLPWAYARTGHVFGFMLLIFLYLTVWFAVRKLVCMAHTLTKRTGTAQLSYGDVADGAILDRWPAKSKIGFGVRVLVDVLLILGLIATACLYIIETASFIKMGIKDPCITVWLLCIMAALLLILLSFINKLKWLVPICFVGNVCLLFGIVLTIVVFYSNIFGSSRDDAAIVKEVFPNYARYIGAVPFVVTWIYAILPIENESKYPQKVVLSYFSPWLLILLVIILMHALLAFLGYDVVGPIVGPNVLAQFFVAGKGEILNALYLIAMGVFLTINLLVLLAAQILWAYLKKFVTPDYEVTMTLVLPPALMLVCLILSVALRDCTVLFAIIVTLTIGLVSFIIPPVLHLILKPDANKPLGWQVIVYIGNGYLIIVGIIVICCGFYTDYTLWKDNKKLGSIIMEH